MLIKVSQCNWNNYKFSFGFKCSTTGQLQLNAIKFSVYIGCISWHYHFLWLYSGREKSNIILKFCQTFSSCVTFTVRNTDDNTFFNRNEGTFSAFIISCRHWYLLLVNLGLMRRPIHFKSLLIQIVSFVEAK